MRERGARWRALRVLSECSVPLTVTRKRKRGRPSGPARSFVFGYRLGLGAPPWGPPHHPGPAVHSDGTTALHYAAENNNRRIIRLLVASGAVVNAQTRGGCAVSAAENRCECAGRVSAAVCRAGTRRCTMPRTKAIRHPSRSCCCVAPTGPSRATSGTAAPRRTAETENRSSRARAGARRSDGRNTVGSSRNTKRERGRCTPPAASLPRHPPCLAPHPSPRCLCRR